MSADMYIVFADDRANVSMVVAPQSWLTEWWGPAARQQNWPTVDRMCDNTLQIFELDMARQFVVELTQLRAVASAASWDLDPEVRAMMLTRLDRMLPALTEAIAGWPLVNHISVG